jgi:hypothetical protein
MKDRPDVEFVLFYYCRLQQGIFSYSRHNLRKPFLRKLVVRKVCSAKNFTGLKQVISTTFLDMGYTIQKNGIPISPHLHGGHTDYRFDGNPESFFSPNAKIVGPHLTGRETSQNTLSMIIAKLRGFCFTPTMRLGSQDSTYMPEWQGCM